MKYFQILKLFLVLTFMLNGIVMAVDYIPRDNVLLTGNLQVLDAETEELQYAQPENILVAQIELPNSENMTDDDWIRGLHYYSVVRLGYDDIPFHYAVSSGGNVYKLNKNGVELEINVQEANPNSVVVAYLSQSGANDFADQSKDDLQELILEIANENSINPENIQIANLRFRLNLQNKTSTLESRNLTGLWEQSLKDIKEYVAGNYNPVPKEYSVVVSNVELPSSSVNPGDVAIIELTLQNTGENTIYADADSALLATKSDGTLSKFFLSNTWASQSQLSILDEGSTIRPGEEVTLQLKFNVPLYFGEQSEQFDLRTVGGQTIEGSEFEVKLTVNNLDVNVVEIVETGTGFLNVRSADSGNAEIITKVSPGERYILKQRGQFGYVQIDLGEGNLGWVSQQYVSIVN